MRQKRFYLALFLIFVVAFFLRFWHLDIRPLHHDEAVGWYYFIRKVVHLQPPEFFFEQHGLLHYLLSSVPIFFFGLSIFSLRFMAALFGSLTVLLFSFLKERIGIIGTLSAALLYAVSPIEIFYSRFLISYPFFNFFFLLFLVSLFIYLKKYQPYFLYLAFFALACMFLTNELAFLYLGVVVLYFFLLFIFDRKKVFAILTKINIYKLVVAICLFLLVFVLIQTVFLTRPYNFAKFGYFFSYVLEKKSREGHIHSFLYYFNIIKESNPAFFGLLFLSLFLILLFWNQKKILFFGLLSFIPLLLLSFVEYKTPWVLATLIFPFFLLFGSVIDLLFNKFKNNRKYCLMILIFLIGILIITIVQSIRLNFVCYASDKNPLNYVGTEKDINRLVEDLLKHSNYSRGNVLIAFTDYYWPIPFYLEEYGFSADYAQLDVAYISKGSLRKYDFVITKSSQHLEVLPKFKKKYELRKGVWIVLWQIK